MIFLGGIHKRCLHLGGGEEVSNNAYKTGQGEGEEDLAVNGHPF